MCFLFFFWLCYRAYGLLVPQWEVKVSQSCRTICDSMEYTVHGILQARILEWVAVSFSRVSSQPSDWNQVSCIAADSLPAESPIVTNVRRLDLHMSSVPVFKKIVTKEIKSAKLMFISGCAKKIPQLWKILKRFITYIDSKIKRTITI